MKRISFLALLILCSCSPKNHKVTFNYKIESTNGKNSFILECYKQKELKEFMDAQGKAFLEGKSVTSKGPEPVGKFNSNGTPEHEFKFVLELPEEDLVCGSDPMNFVTVRVGENAGQVFKPTADTEINVFYNMYTKKYYKADSPGAKVTIVK